MRGDIGGNIERLAAAQARDAARYGALFPIILDEVARGEQHGRQSDTNGLLWLKRCAPLCPPATSICCTNLPAVHQEHMRMHVASELQLIWCCLLRRACEFILLLLKRLHDDRAITLSAAANEVYYQTLNKYHAWYTATAFVVALKVTAALLPRFTSVVPAL